METPAQNGPSEAEVTTLAGTIQELVGVVKDLKRELSDQREELKQLRAEKKKKTTKSSSSQKAARPPRVLFPSIDLDLMEDLSGGTSSLGDLLSGPPPYFGLGQRPANADQTFHMFSKLPPELRMRIWKMALPGGRLFEPYFDPPHRLSAAAGGNPAGVVTFNFGAAPAGVNIQAGGPNVNVAGANGGGANAGANVQAPPTPRPDPPLVRLGSAYPPPRIRAVCREARNAALEAGAFEFGLFKTARRGYWFNHSSDMVKIAAEAMQVALLQHIDLSRVQLIAFSHNQFKTEQSCIAVLDLILNHAPRCRKVILFFDQDPRYTYRHPPSCKANYWSLRDDDVVGNHTFPASRGISSGPARWSDLHRVVNDVWKEHLVSRNSEPTSAPEFVGMDLIRPSRLY